MWVVVHRLVNFLLAVTWYGLRQTVALRPATLYWVSNVFNVLCNNLGGFTFHASRQLGDGLTGCARIQKFLLLDEIVPDENSSDLKPKPEDCMLEMVNFTGRWDKNVEQNTLEDVSLKVTTGQLIAVIGPVGCGKSSLLLAILGELPSLKGTVRSVGSIGYVSQQPWIFSGSVRQNILFGATYDKARYDRIVKVTAMTRDFEIMPQGDATLIGDRGVSLSGGQKARVSLARALYMDADIYLLDDPLSAVDTAVGRHIFEKCIVQYLSKKPRILVTHQVQYLPVADKIYILKEGQISSQGSYDDLSQSGVDFSELLKRAEEQEEPTFMPSSPRSNIADPMPDFSAVTGSCRSLNSVAEDYVPEPVSMPEEEERALGTVGFKVYVDFFKAGAGIIKFLLLVCLNIFAQTMFIGSDWWLSRWSNQEEEKYAATRRYNDYLEQNNVSSTTNVTIPHVDSEFNVAIFGSIIAAVFVFGITRALLFFKICIDASQTLHNRMFNRILRSPIAFFDTNPVGRILNRFSKDIGHMDDILPVTFFDFVQCFLLIIGIVLVAGVVNPYVFIPTVPLLILFIFIRSYYIKTSRSIKRLEGTSRSPVFSYLSATLQGLSTIRAMKMEPKCAKEFDLYQDRHSEAWFLFLATSRWLAVRLDWLSVMFIITVTFCSLFVADTLSAGLAGLSITYSMSLMGMFQWGIRQSAEVENQMISVERVLEYTQLPQEADLDSKKDRKPPKGWPSDGSITGTDVSLQYSSTAPFVLKGLSFLIKAREKIGIVGRTGAGKSSLISTLFRMVEPKGHLSIDKVDILSIGLHDLRKVISIIPQDPFLFSGPLRKNLDPFAEHSDEKLWSALEEVQLKEAVKELPGELEANVSEGGSNLSVGQRQLICLARAVLRHNKILLIDEATANVDPITDECIQATIRSKFRQCTVLTIAHRLHTIMDSDRVMVLSEGQIVEFDTPLTLLKDTGGIFHGMAQQTGKAEFEHLMEIAQAAITGKIKMGSNVDNTMNDITLSLNESDDGLYDIADIEDSLRDANNDDKSLASKGSSVDEKSHLRKNGGKNITKNRTNNDDDDDNDGDDTNLISGKDDDDDDNDDDDDDGDVDSKEDSQALLSPKRNKAGHLTEDGKTPLSNGREEEEEEVGAVMNGVNGHVDGDVDEPLVTSSKRGSNNNHSNSVLT